MFDHSQWIYAACPVEADQYTEYVFSLPKAEVGEDAILRISCDTDYTLFINGAYVASNQYGDFEHYKIYDTLDITSHLGEDANRVKILLYYCGVDTQRYRTAPPGLLYEAVFGDRVVATSGEETLSRLSPTYLSGIKRFVTHQLGFSFTYDANREGEGGYAPSVLTGKKVRLFPRPISKLTLLPPCPMVEVQGKDGGVITVDLGREVVGLAQLSFASPCAQRIRVAWGENLDGGRVRSHIGDRKFYFEYIAKKGENRFTNHMLRLGCRYLEIQTEAPITLSYAGLLPQVYEVEPLPTPVRGEDGRIYDACVNTLRLCMMEHYVDTPWREQCLYAFDSRNQMLCGYYVFPDGNRDYARANLRLLGEDRREDGLLSICAPCGSPLAIPSFSLHYIIAMEEYLAHTGDTTLGAEYSEKMEGILQVFLQNAEGGLIQCFQGPGMWNFYDWSEHLAGTLGTKEPPRADLVINCLTVLALDAYERICRATGRPFPFGGVAEGLRTEANRAFWRQGLYTLHEGAAEYTTLGNALAVLSGVAKGKEREICDRILQGETTPSSLSMSIFQYTAMLQTDKDRYREGILREIRKVYGEMGKTGDTVWETAQGWKDFHNAGSLCHGWSAVPILLYHWLGEDHHEKN